MRFRLVITQGPVQSLVASAVTRFLEDQGSHLQSILVAGGFASESRSLVEATLACAAWGAWKGTLHVDDAVDGAIDEGLPDPAEVEEVLCVRNWQAVNERLLDRYRDAHRIAYGDGLGVIDLVRAPGQPAVDEVVAPVPQVEREGALDGLAVRMVPAAYLHESIAAVRTAEPGLVSLDDEMARYAEGGVVALTGNLTEAGLTTYPRELAHFRGLIEIAASAPSAIVVKGHPRATLAQATGLARLMRARGHQTRVLLHERYGSFPIETFPALIRSAATVQAGWSSAAVSLAYLHGARVVSEMPLSLSASTLFPSAWKRARLASRHHREAIAAVRQWSGDGPLASVPIPAPGPATRAVAAVAANLGGWRAVREPIDAVRWSAESAAIEAGGGAPGSELVEDPAVPAIWAVAPGQRERVSDLIATAPTSAPARLRTVLAGLRSAGDPVPHALVAGVRAPTHWPTHHRARPSEVQGASLRAEQLEGILEEHVEISLRVPELADTDRRIPPGIVRFHLRERS